MDCILLDTLRYNDEEKRLEKSKKSILILIIAVVSLLILLIFGTILFSSLFNLDGLDGLYAATLLTTSVDIKLQAETTGQKWFIIIYSILSIVVYLSLASASVNYFLSSL